MATASYAGIDFWNPDSGLNDWLQAKYSLDLARITAPQRVWPGNNLSGLAFPAKFPARPRLRVGEFFYPVGCRWSEYTGLADTNAALQMFAAAYPGGSATSLPFVMTVNGEGVATNMFMLPPRPLNGFDTVGLGMFLINLVDERYFGSPTAQQTWNANTTWDDFFQGLATVLGISLTYSAIDDVYGSPDLDSDLAYGTGENAWLILESAATMVGRTVLRNFDGTYELLTADEAKAIKDENLAEVDLALAGGDAFGEESTPMAAFGLLPGTVQVSFPKVMKGSWYASPTTTHLRGPINSSQVYVKSIDITDVEGYSGFTGTDETKAFKDTAKAIYSDINSTPDNQSNLDDLALQIAQDYYDFHFSGLDITLPGIVNWTPDGLHDLIFTNNADKCQSRIQCKPWNYDVEEYCHSTDDNPMPALVPGCWGKITAIASSPDSTGYHPCSWTQQDPDSSANPPWQNTASGIVSSSTDNTAYADNDEDANVGDVYWMRVADNGKYRFSVGGGSGDSIETLKCTGTTADSNGFYPAVIATLNVNTGAWSFGTTTVKFKPIGNPPVAPDANERYSAVFVATNSGGVDCFQLTQHIVKCNNGLNVG